MRQAKAWRLCRDLDDYIEAMRATVASLPKDTRRKDAETWVDWAVRHREGIDPLRGLLSVPEPPEPEPDELSPFLGGLSPWGQGSMWNRR